eukprot:17935-Heterococcus_DN1.PRE.7
MLSTLVKAPARVLTVYTAHTCESIACSLNKYCSLQRLLAMRRVTSHYWYSIVMSLRAQLCRHS